MPPPPPPPRGSLFACTAPSPSASGRDRAPRLPLLGARRPAREHVGDARRGGLRRRGVAVADRPAEEPVLAKAGPVIRAVAQDERSQARNRELAVERLVAEARRRPSRRATARPDHADGSAERRLTDEAPPRRGEAKPATPSDDDRARTRAGRAAAPRPPRAARTCTRPRRDDAAPRPVDAPEGAVATADHQEAGRGRHGRRWEDAPGTALLVSVLLPPAGRGGAQLSLICALSVAEVVERGAALEARVKWPNDVLVDGRKVAGILLEARGRRRRLRDRGQRQPVGGALPADARAQAALASDAHRRRAPTVASCSSRSSHSSRRATTRGARRGSRRSSPSSRRAMRCTGAPRSRSAGSPATRWGSRRTGGSASSAADGAERLVASGEVATEPRAASSGRRAPARAGSRSGP